MIFVLDYGMGLASLLFIYAYYLAKKKRQPLHQYVAATATALTVAIGLALIILVRLVHMGDLGATGIQAAEGIEPLYIIIHRICASIVFLWMLALAYLGYKKRVNAHKKTALPFLILYLLVYGSGLLFFTAK